MNTFKSILLRRKNKVILPETNNLTLSTEQGENSLIYSLIENIKSLGFSFDHKLIFRLSDYSKEEITAFSNDLIPELVALVGADREYEPMYPNFPKEVMDSSEALLRINAYLHYSSLGKWLPYYEKEERPSLNEETSLTYLSIGTEEDVWEIFQNLLCSKTSLSQQDISDIFDIVEFVVKNKKEEEFFKHLPYKDSVVYRENVAIIGKIFLTCFPKQNYNLLISYFKTTTDVLRLITLLSEGDASLAEKIKYKHFKRSERRFLMDLLTSPFLISSLKEDMWKYREEWLRIGEILHPFEFKNSKYCYVREAFDSIRNESKPMFAAGEIESAIQHNSPESAVEFLQFNAGDFARRLDKLLRDAEDKHYIVDNFKKVATKVSSPVLLQVRQHFLDRNSDSSIRVAFPKGQMSKAVTINNKVPFIPDRYCDAIVTICEEALIEKFSEKDSLGKVYIHPSLKRILVSFSQRSSSVGSKILPRGSRISLKENKDVIRAFVWWTNTKDSGRVDVDLSTAMYDDNFNYIGHISYTNLRFKGCCLSGDITDGGEYGGKGASEFLDFRLSKLPKDVKYLAFQIYCYTEQNFSDFPCRIGWMKRQGILSGEIYEPSTIEMSFDLASKSASIIPMIFDCQNQEFIFCDLTAQLPRDNISVNNLETNLKGITAACYAMTHLSKPNLFDLIALNVRARGKRVYTPEEADIIFTDTPSSIYSYDKDIQIMRTAYDTDYIVSQLL